MQSSVKVFAYISGVLVRDCFAAYLHTYTAHTLFPARHYFTRS